MPEPITTAILAVIAEKPEAEQCWLSCRNCPMASGSTLCGQFAHAAISTQNRRERHELSQPRSFRLHFVQVGQTKETGVAPEQIKRWRPLSQRELEIARLYASGHSHKQLARLIDIAPTTVRSHLNTIYRKLGVSSKIALLNRIAQADPPCQDEVARQNGDPTLVVTSAQPSMTDGHPVHVAPSRSSSASVRTKRLLTMVVVELMAPTDLRNGSNPDQLDELVGARRQAAGELIRSLGGQSVATLGDTMTVCFGWPQALEDHAERAVRAALGLRGELEATRDDTAMVRVRIGIASGDVVVAGSSDHLDEVVGGAASMAAYLARAAAPGEILVDGQTAELVRQLFSLDRLAEIPAGDHLPALVSCAIGAALPSVNRFAVRHTRAPLPMIGRRLELDLLLDRQGHVRTGLGQAILLIGEAGIGKSRLVHAMLEAAADTLMARDIYQCSPLLTDADLHPFLPSLLAALRSGDDRQSTLATLRETLSAIGHRDPIDLVLLADVLGLSGADATAAHNLEPEARRRRTLEIIAGLLLSRHAAGVLIVEDIHWLDPSSARLIELLLERIAARPILLVMTARPHALPAHCDLHDLSVIHLIPLTPVETTELVTQLADGVLDEALCEQIAGRSNGIPLFAEELTSVVLERGAKMLHDGSTVPLSLRSVLLARIDSLGPTKRLLQIAAVLGQTFDADLLKTLAEQDARGADASLQDLIRAGLVQPQTHAASRIHTFKHALVRDAAYGSLTGMERRALHALAFEQMRCCHGDDPAEFATLAHHAFAAELWPQARIFHGQAGTTARQRWAIREAITHYGRALTSHRHLMQAAGADHDRERIELTLACCECSYFDGQFRESFDLLLGENTALDSLADAGLRGRGRYWLARLASRVGGHHEVAREAAHQAIADAGSCGDWQTMGEAYSVLCVDEFFAGHPDASIAAGRRSVDCLERAGPSDKLAFSYHYIACAHTFAGRFDMAHETCAQVLEHARRLVHPRLACYGHSIGGWALGMAGRLAEGVAELDQAIDEAPDQASRMFATGYLGCVLVERGDLAQALPLLREATKACTRFPAPQYASLFGGTLAEAQRRLDHVQDAQAAAYSADVLAQAAGFPFGQGLACRVLGRLATDTNDAMARLGHAAEILAAAGAHFELARTYADLVQVATCGQRNQDRAEHYRQQVARLLSRLGQTARQGDIMMAAAGWRADAHSPA